MFPLNKDPIFICLSVVATLLIISNNVQPTHAILNCFNPNMFKMNKQPLVGDRANWYPQQQQQYGYNQMNYAGYNQANPMR